MDATRSVVASLAPLLTVLLPLRLGAADAVETPPPDPYRRLEEALRAEPGLSPEFKAAMEDAIHAMEEQRTKAKEADAFAAILAKLKVFGDFRYRHESDFSIEGDPNRNRERIRFRLGATYKVLPSVTVGARITTGSREDPRSPHQTLGEEFDKFEVNLDRAYATFQPSEVIPGFTLTGGKFMNPLISYSIYSELVWDADVQPTGVAAGLDLAQLVKEKPAWISAARLDVAGYFVSEYQLSDDAYALATQAAIELKPVEKWKLQAAVDYYYYTDLTPDGESTAFGENSGNATVDTDGNAVADEFLSRFAIIEPSAAVTCEMLPLPVTVSAEYIKNLRGDKDVGSRGYALGGAVGSNQKKGDYRLYYQWQVVEQDAVLSLFSQDDFPRNTNLRGHVFGASFVPADPVLLHAWFLVSRAEDPAPGQSEDYRWRFRFDINVKF